MSEGFTDGASISPPLVQAQDRDGVRILSLNRPHARNALSLAMLDSLSKELEYTATNPAIKAIVLTAEGPTFSSGHDLKELSSFRDDPDRGRERFLSAFAKASQLMQQIVSLPQPVIAAVEGTATAAGCQLVATCDLAIAGKAAKFATPGVNIGLFCSTPMVALSRNLSRKQAMEMLLLGETANAEDALRFGLVNRIVSVGDALKEALNLAKKIAEKSPITIQYGKRTFYEQLEMPLTDAYAHANTVMCANMLEDDAREGIAAFFEKRPACWGMGEQKALIK